MIYIRNHWQRFSKKNEAVGVLNSFYYLNLLAAIKKFSAAH